MAEADVAIARGDTSVFTVIVLLIVRPAYRAPWMRVPFTRSLPETESSSKRRTTRSGVRISRWIAVEAHGRACAAPGTERRGRLYAGSRLRRQSVAWRSLRKEYEMRRLWAQPAP